MAAKSMLQKTMGEGFVMLAVNGAVLGLMIQNAELGFGEALISSVGVGLGFMAAMTVFASLRERVEDEFVPAAFRGLPVSLLIAAMMSLVLFAF
jgi:electron transport complex protein RnfA